MTSKDEQVRAAIAEQASEWFVANDEAPLDAQERTVLVAWLKASPAHVEEFLGVASVARDLHLAGAAAQSSVAELVALARAEKDDPVQVFGSGARSSPGHAAPRWQPFAVAAAVAGMAGLGALWLWNLRLTTHAPLGVAATALHYQTGHGEQQTHPLADGSVLHLNTDSAVTVRYGAEQRLIVLEAGEADFEVVHDPKRSFRVMAGAAQVLDLGTRFDVRVASGSTVVTVVEGQVAVTPAPRPGRGGTASGHLPQVQVGPNEQLSVSEGRWPATPIAVDAQRATAWLHRQIEFEHEPLERVAAEFNRYARKPIEITAPALRGLEVSGVFSIDDPEEFVAFLRSLDGVRVEVTATKIRVSQK